MKSVTLQVLAMFGMNNLQIINYCSSNNKKQKCDLETKPSRSDKPSRSLPRPAKTLSNIAFNTRQNLRGVTNMACTVAQGGKHHLLKIYQAENRFIQTRPSLKNISSRKHQTKFMQLHSNKTLTQKSFKCSLSDLLHLWHRFGTLHGVVLHN